MNLFYILLFLLLCCIITIILLITSINKKKKVLEKVVLEKHDLEVLRKGELKEYFDEEWNKQEQELEDKLRRHKQWIESEQKGVTNVFEEKKNYLQLELDKINGLLKEKEVRYTEVNQDLDLYREGKIKEIDSTAAEYEQRKQLIVDNSINTYRELQLKKANETFDLLEDEIKGTKEELKTIKSELEEERRRRAAVNEEILRARKIEEQQDFYRIQLDPNDKDDVEILRGVAPRLRHPEAINKVIWTAYYQKPLAELRKRLLPNGDMSGIYKITRLKTNEIYIGQSTSLDRRFQDHCKTALGCGTLASSQLHRMMSLDGPENYVWEVLEKVPKDKLRERESYYIDFYDSKTYGLNSITGDKNK